MQHGPHGCVRERVSCSIKSHEGSLTRREFINLIGVSAAALPQAARAQQVSKVYRVGLVAQAVPVSQMAGPEPINRAAKAFVYALRDLGYVEGQNLILERRSLELKQERSVDIAVELGGLGIDVIVTSGNDMAREMARATPGVPIVMALSSDPVEAGLVASLARPGGPITGVTGECWSRDRSQTPGNAQGGRSVGVPDCFLR
jgi:putative tryptophan/tyrosine transport system substrate-binding protein